MVDSSDHSTVVYGSGALLRRKNAKHEKKSGWKVPLAGCHRRDGGAQHGHPGIGVAKYGLFSRSQAVAGC